MPGKYTLTIICFLSRFMVRNKRAFLKRSPGRRWAKILQLYIPEDFKSEFVGFEIR